MKKVLGILALVCMASAANAALVSCSSISTNGATTVGQLQASGGCQDQDKQYTDWLGALPADTVIKIQLVAGVSDTHIVNIGDLAIGSYPFSYVISIDPLSPTFAFENITMVTLGFDSAGVTGNSATKLIYAGGTLAGGLIDTLFATGGTDSTGPISQKSLLISETIDVTNTSYQSTTNAFTQEAVPEPATNALIGCGLLSLVLMSRKKKA